jgi:hypothetical protein
MAHLILTQEPVKLRLHQITMELHQVMVLMAMVSFDQSVKLLL